MKCNSIIASGLAVTLSLAVITSSLSAQVVQPGKPNQPGKLNQAVQAGKLDTKTTGANVRASPMIGRSIENNQEKSVGQINDIVIDANDGQVRYLAVTYGGFLGVGNKMFAVPYKAFKCQQDPNDRDEYVLVLNVTQKQLEGSTGFDEEHWPDFGDQKFIAVFSLAQRMQSRTYRNRSAPGSSNSHSPIRSSTTSSPGDGS